MGITILNEQTNGDVLQIAPLHDKTVAVLGYGNQGAAHACNLRDSGVDVVVANRRDTANGHRARADGFEPCDIAHAVHAGDLIIVALPDEAHGEIFRASIADELRPGQTLGFLHGFSVRFGLVQAPAEVGVVMVAPKGPGALVRSSFIEGRGLPCLFAVEQESAHHDAEQLGLAWATAIGCARAGVIRTTFADEAETDLFGEQAVLCGGVMALMLAAFEIMLERGYPPEVAYIECCHELKQVVDLVYTRGPAGMMDAISNTAEFGAHEAIARFDGDELRQKMAALLADIRSGRFAARFVEDAHAENSVLAEYRHRLQTHPIEAASRAVRSMMPWLGR